jgi:hypothetical protein
MTEYNFPEKATYGDIYTVACTEIHTAEEAEKWLKAVVKHIMAHTDKEEFKTESGARGLALHNLGYYAGYYSHETRERVYKLFNTKHPIFGGKMPTPEEAFKMGKDMGEKLRKEKGNG